MLVVANQQLEQFVATRTMAECYQRAVDDGFMMAPLYTFEDIANDKHLAARDYWVEIEGKRYPGPFAKLSETPLQLTRPAPTLGQDQSLLAEVGRAPRRTGTAPRSSNGVRGEDGGALSGVKIADFAWVGVGPLISKSMADHGATVIHIESSTRPDVLRLAPPFKDNQPGIDRGQFMANFNSSKYGVALRLDTEQGLDYARQLVDWADVVVESFTPGTLKRFGLDYRSGLLEAAWHDGRTEEALHLARLLVSLNSNLLLGWVVSARIGDEDDKALAKAPLEAMDPDGEYAVTRFAYKNAFAVPTDISVSPEDAALLNAAKGAF